MNKLEEQSNLLKIGEMMTRKELQMEIKYLKSLNPFADAVGDFIRYWGFRRIHGQIWAMVFLSQRPLSGMEICKILDVSKALVSPALRQLEKYELLHQVSPEGQKKKLYEANSDIFSVIRNVLKQRETKMIQEAKLEHKKLQIKASKDKELFERIDAQRFQLLETMLHTAELAVSSIVESVRPEVFQEIPQQLTENCQSGAVEK